MSNVINFKDLGRKETRCMLYELEQGDVLVEYKDLDNFKVKYENVVEVYNPNKEQKQMILNVIGDNLEIEENKMKTKISDEDFLLSLIKELTNIKLDLDKEKDKELIQSILDNPSDLLLRVKLEIDKICNNVFYLWYDNIKELSKTPDELKDALLLVQEEKEEEINQEELEKQNKIQELEKQLKTLKGEDNV